MSARWNIINKMWLILNIICICYDNVTWFNSTQLIVMIIMIIIIIWRDCYSASCLCFTQSKINHNNNTNSKTMFMVLSLWQSHCESSPGSFDECRTAPSGCWPQDQTRRLRLWVCLYRLSESTPTIAIYYYYSTWKPILILPSHGG